MFEFLRGAAFELVKADAVQTAMAELASRFPQLDKPEEPARLQEEIVLPFRQALARAEPKLLVTLQVRGELEAYVRLGGQVFPLVVKDSQWNTKRLVLRPGIPAADFDVERVKQAKTWEDVYGRKDVDKVTVERAQAQFVDPRLPRSTSVYFNERKVEDVPYAWALWEACASALRRAEANSDRVETVERARVGAPESIFATALAALLRGRGVRVATGPGGERLEFAGSWRGMPVVLTSSRAGGALQLWVQDRVEQQTFWRPVDMPAGVALPVRGVSGLIVGDKLHLYGGLDAKGQSTKTHLTLDLARAKRADFASGARSERELSGALWEQGRPLLDATSFAAAVALDDRPYLMGGLGLEAYYLQRGDQSSAMPELEKARAARRLNHQDRTVVESRDAQAGWARRDPPPGALTLASAVVGNGAILLGPGAGKDGRCFCYDVRHQGAWFELPSLPAGYGMGQLHLDGALLRYTAGESGDRPSDEVWVIDLGRPRAKWELEGRAKDLAGAARLVESYGRMMSLIVSPEGSATVYPGQREDR